NALGGWDYVASSTLGGAGGSGTVGDATKIGQIPYYAATGDVLTATSAIFIDTTGYVGIGTTSPSEKLTVDGSILVLQATGTAPVFISSITDNLGDIYEVFVAGNYAYAVDENNNTMFIYDISDPTQINEIASTTSNLSLPQSIFVSGKYAYVINYKFNADGGLLIYDISDPYNIQFIASTTNDNLYGSRKVYVKGEYAYVANYHNSLSYPTLAVFDISNPNSINLIGTTSSGSVIRYSDIYVQGNYAYLVGNDGQNGLEI
ncbi:unnamed protein product, partial [marine sediment metagenome]